METPRPLDPREAYEAIQRLLDGTSDALSFSRHAGGRAAERGFTRRDDQHVLTHGTVGSCPEWDSRFQGWKYRVAGTDLDGDDLTFIVSIDVPFNRIVIITGF